MKEQDQQLAEAKLLAEKGMVSKAERAVRQYLDKNKDSAFGHFLFGYILFREIQESAGVKSGTPAAAYSEKVADGSDTGTREAKAKASLAEYTEGAKYHDPSALDLKIVALDYVLLGDSCLSGCFRSPPALAVHAPAKPKMSWFAEATR
ncbi:MAG TPA: hypothetical protein VK937_01655 [Candidatus Limnocylindria bacterium]|nr:hypothetical protein [Candidatus Limnocylindria bacterium]